MKVLFSQRYGRELSNKTCQMSKVKQPCTLSYRNSNSWHLACSESTLEKYIFCGALQMCMCFTMAEVFMSHEKVHGPTINIYTYILGWVEKIRFHPLRAKIQYLCYKRPSGLHKNVFFFVSAGSTECLKCRFLHIFFFRVIETGSKCYIGCQNNFSSMP